MPSEAKALLTAQTEKPNHYSYLKEFRVEQCSQFQQHKCTQHRPYTCFYWHFLNQRRRRPVRKRDGSFNYSADNYCPKYDETTGECPDGDDCPLLHRTAGDTERRYHLRYYKTCKCVHDTDSRGYCVKNGLHCAFAHGEHDLRPPVYDINEIRALESAEAEGNQNGPNVLDKERNLMNEDPKWQDTNYVLANYKTEQCKRPPRLCRQGYACPQYHNSKDKRRSPRKFKYRSTPCPNVKHGEDWGEPSNCESGDQCQYCHTRTEQQFHPEIYKSTKCNDVQQAGYCPRGVFCAFAHVEQEMCAAREAGVSPLDIGPNLADILSSALPPSTTSSSVTNNSQTSAATTQINHFNNMDQKKSSDNKFNESSNGDVLSEASSECSNGSNRSSICNKAPGAQLSKNQQILSGGGGVVNHLNDNNSNLLNSVVTSLSNQFQQQLNNNQLLNNNNSSSAFSGLSSFGGVIDYRNELNKQMLASLDSTAANNNDTNSQTNSNSLAIVVDRKTTSNNNTNSFTTNLGPFYSQALNTSSDNVVQSVVGNALDLNLDDSLNLSGGLIDSSDLVDTVANENSFSAGLASILSNATTAPVNIPTRSNRPFSPTASSPAAAAVVLQQQQQQQNAAFGGTNRSQAASNNSVGNSILEQLNSKFSSYGTSLFDFANSMLNSNNSNNHQTSAATAVRNNFSLDTTSLTNNLDLNRVSEELFSYQQQQAVYAIQEQITQARLACDAWRRECDEAKRKLTIAEAQRDETMQQLKGCQMEIKRLQIDIEHVKLDNERYRNDIDLLKQKAQSPLIRHCLAENIGNLSLPTLKQIQSNLRADTDEVEKAVYFQTAAKCMVCEERNRTVTLECNHHVLCDTCAPVTQKCPYCSAPTNNSIISNSLCN